MAASKDSGSKKYSPMTIAIAAVGGAVVGGLGYMLIAKMYAPATGTSTTGGASTTPSGQVFLPVPMGPKGLAFGHNVATVR